MAWTQTDLDNIEKAIAKGYLSVRHSDGKTITYRSTDELLKARDRIKQQLSKSQSKRRPMGAVIRTTKGL